MHPIAPGSEPEEIKKLLDVFLSALDNSFPDGIIIWDEWNHEKWDKPAGYLCKSLGYSKGADFLRAYGYQILQSRVPSFNLGENLETQIIENSASTKVHQGNKREKPYKLRETRKNKAPAAIIAVAFGMILIVAGFLAFFFVFRNLSSDDTISRTNASGSTSGSKIPVISVISMTYDDAVAALNSAGFTNVTSNLEPNSDGKNWIVTKQSVNEGKKIRPDEQIILTCSSKCKLYIDLHSEGNLLFNTYDITVKLDGNDIGTIPNGDNFTYLADVLTGKHVLYFCKSGNTSPKASRTITISEDTTFSCDLAHGGSSIDIKNEEITGNIDGSSLKVIDVTGKVLSKAMDMLQHLGFSNVREEPFGSIWDKNNWVVVSQGLAAGTIADKNDFIQLNCIKLDDYFTNTYVGKNVNEIQKSASSNGFRVRYESTSYSDMNNDVQKMDENEKNDWIASKARQYGGADSTALVTIFYNGVATPAPSSIPTTTPKPATRTSSPSTPRPVSTPKPYSYHSSGSKEIAKKGDSGVYAFKSRGGSYAQYYIIDFDAGYVYYFCDGNGDTTGERVKINSGDLNNGLYVFYHDGSDQWLNVLHFAWKNQPDHLVLVDNDGMTWDYYQEFLDDALRIKAKKTFYDY